MRLMHTQMRSSTLLFFLSLISLHIWTASARPTSRSPSASCSVPIPAVFNCDGLPEWEAFLEIAVQYSAAGFPISSDIFQVAHALVEKWSDKPYPPQEFHYYLCGVEQWPPAEGFCLFGFVTALFINARHLMSSDDAETRKIGQQDFLYAVTCLGKEGSVDFLDSSSWPVNILDMYININATAFMTYKHYAVKFPIPAPFEAADPVPEEYDGSVEPLSLAVFGTHATLTMEPVEMLKMFVTHKAVFYGLEQRWCDILAMCESPSESSMANLFEAVNRNPFDYPWDVMESEVHRLTFADEKLRTADLIVCTEPVIGCIMAQRALLQLGRVVPILAYLGVALLNTVPPPALPQFWQAWDDAGAMVIATNNHILKAQIYYQTGVQVPYVRAHGLYAKMQYMPTRPSEILFWRAPLFLYPTFRCALLQFLATVDYPLAIRFMEEGVHVAYSEVQSYRGVLLLPWDHALMTFYELYSAVIPLFLPNKEWMYRILYQRGQLSVGEPIYQSLHPTRSPPKAKFAHITVPGQESGALSMQRGLSSAQAARGIAEDMLTRAMNATSFDEQRQYLSSGLDLVKDMAYFLAAARNATDGDSYTSMGKVSRVSHVAVRTEANMRVTDEPWHPYTPFQISPDDSNEWTRMRKSGWWLRRGVRFDAMRYWYQFSDFYRFPGIAYFDSIPDLLCKMNDANITQMVFEMSEYNDKTLIESRTFWKRAVHRLVSAKKT